MEIDKKIANKEAISNAYKPVCQRLQDSLKSLFDDPYLNVIKNY
jgi:hypothetical protein